MSGSGSVGKTCRICTVAYQKAEQLVNSGRFATAAKVTVGAVVAAVGNALGGAFGASLGSGAVQAVVPRVVKYVRQNGFSKTAPVACADMGFCP